MFVTLFRFVLLGKAGFMPLLFQLKIGVVVGERAFFSAFSVQKLIACFLFNISLGFAILRQSNSPKAEKNAKSFAPMYIPS